MASRFKDVKDEVTALKDAAETLITQKSTRVRDFENWCDEKNGLEKNPETVRPEQLHKVLEHFFACMCKEDGTNHDNLSPMILKGNQMVYS